MVLLKDKAPGYLLSKTHLWGTVTFAALFALIYIVLNIPFIDDAWFEIGATKAFTYTMVFFVLALAIMIVSKILLYMVNKKRHGVTMATYVLWLMAELIVVSFLYAILTESGLRQSAIVHSPEFGLNVLKALKYAVVALGFPYIFTGMYFAINDKDKIIRVMNYSTVVSDEEVAPKDEKKITLFDNNGVLKLSLSSANLYYIESDDNYIKVWYTDSHEVLKQYMLRCRLKTVEESFVDSSLVRCHRKYIVNMDRVKVLRKEKDLYVIELDNEQIQPIPITKTYEEHVLARFNDSRG